MTEKKLFIRMISAAGVLLLAFILFNFVFMKAQDRTFTDTVYNVYFPMDQVEPDFIYSFDTPGVAELVSATLQEDSVLVVVKPIAPGTVTLECHAPGDTNPDNFVYVTRYKVYSSGMIRNIDNKNFTGYTVTLISICVYLLLNICILLISFRTSIKTLRYSYFSIFSFGILLWLIILSGFMLYVLLTGDDMDSAIKEVTGCANRFIQVTLPFILAFSVEMSVSNISLIKHERMRFRNILGMLCSFILIFGIIFMIWFEELFTSGSDFQFKIWDSINNVFACLYALLECFLIGSVVCGFRAARHEPEYDKDFIVILGCKVKKDGTLYPLIRGRVDRAIGFYKKQLEKTGKKAYFIPSGGQGNDETISEADAMARYLIEQGIPEEQIIIENQSKNTKQNMQFSRKIMEERKPGAKAAFSTTNFHVFRSGIIARQCGMDMDGMGSTTKWYFWPNAYVREVIGMLVYEWRVLLLIFVILLSFLTAVQFIF